MNINLITGTGKQTIEAIKYLLSTIPEIPEDIDFEDIMETLDLLSADMLDAQDDIRDLQTATGNLSTAVGTNTSDIGALDTRVTALEQSGGSKKKLAEYDFTTSLIDSVSQNPAILSETGVERGSSGLSFTTGGRVTLEPVFSNYATYEIKFGDFTYAGDTSSNARLFMNDSEHGLLVWHSMSGKWGMYQGTTWTDFTSLNSFDSIKNKTLKFVIDGKNLSLYVDDTLVQTTSNSTINLNTLTLFFGSTSNVNLNGVIIESFDACIE